MCCYDGISANGGLVLMKHFVHEDGCGICPKEQWKSIRIIRGEIPLRDTKKNWGQFRRASKMLIGAVIFYIALFIAILSLHRPDSHKSASNEYIVLANLERISAKIIPKIISEESDTGGVLNEYIVLANLERISAKIIPKIISEESDTGAFKAYTIMFLCPLLLITNAALIIPCVCLYACCKNGTAGLKARYWHGFLEVEYECKCEFEEGRRRFRRTYHAVHRPTGRGVVIRTQETKKPWRGYYKAPIIRVMNKIEVPLSYNVIEHHFRTMPVYVGRFYTCKRWARDLNKLLFHRSIESAVEEDHQRIEYAQFVTSNGRCKCSKNNQYSTTITFLQLHIEESYSKKLSSFLFGECWRKIARLPPNPHDKPNHFAVQIDYECRDPEHPPGSPQQFTLTYENRMRKSGTRCIEGRYEHVFDDGTSKEVGKNITEIKKLFAKIPRMPTSISWAEAFYCEVCELDFGFGEEIALTSTMVFKLSDAKEFGEFEEQEGLCRCNPAYEHLVALRIRRVEVPMCKEIVADGVKILRRGAGLAGIILTVFGTACAMVGTFVQVVLQVAPKVNEDPIHGCVQVDYKCENEECNKVEPFKCSITYQYNWKKNDLQGFYKKLVGESEEFLFTQKITHSQIKEVYNEMPSERNYILRNTSRDWAKKFMKDLKDKFN
ncbi:hypothetical protein M3Y97_01091700 [Aphelenchoides bicaudatus]|nr:hypothetical protein M3Y97_01091700 [Aphelenchoides bicaudatus]